MGMQIYEKAVTAKKAIPLVVNQTYSLKKKGGGNILIKILDLWIVPIMLYPLHDLESDPIPKTSSDLTLSSSKGKTFLVYKHRQSTFHWHACQ